MNNFKINKPKFLIAILIVTLISCDTFDSHKHLTGRYYLNHTKFGKCVGYKVYDNRDDYLELINGTFNLIGFDNNYIIVERDEHTFFIIPIYKEMTYSPEKGILGPLNPKQFNEQKNKLKIKANFTMSAN